MAAFILLPFRSWASSMVMTSIAIAENRLKQSHRRPLFMPSTVQFSAPCLAPLSLHSVIGQKVIPEVENATFKFRSAVQTAPLDGLYSTSKTKKM